MLLLKLTGLLAGFLLVWFFGLFWTDWLLVRIERRRNAWRRRRALALTGRSWPR